MIRMTRAGGAQERPSLEMRGTWRNALLKEEP